MPAKPAGNKNASPQTILIRQEDSVKRLVTQFGVVAVLALFGTGLIAG
jgi:hypothetical protein